MAWKMWNSTSTNVFNKFKVAGKRCEPRTGTTQHGRITELKKSEATDIKREQVDTTTRGGVYMIYMRKFVHESERNKYWTPWPNKGNRGGSKFQSHRLCPN